jgi:hypothetical protein
MLWGANDMVLFFFLDDMVLFLLEIVNNKPKEGGSE